MKQRDRFIQLHKELWSNFYYDLGADMKFLDIELERIYQGFQLGEVSGIEYALDVADRHADGMATDAELAAAWDAARAAAWDAAWDAGAAARDTQKKKLIEILTDDWND